MMNKEFLLKHGFEEVSLDGMKEILQQHSTVKDLYIDTNITEPISMLIGRTRTKKAIITLEKVENWQERLIVVQSDRLKTRLFNIPLEEMENILVKHYENGLLEIVFDIAEKGISVQICFQA